MHELGMAQAVLARVLRHPEVQAGARVREVRLAIGDKSPLDRFRMLFCLNAISQGTPVQGARWGVSVRPGTGLSLEELELEASEKCA